MSAIFFCLNPGEQENIDKFSKRLVKVTKQHNDECKKLLTLMGVPYIEVRSLSLCYNSCWLYYMLYLYWQLTSFDENLSALSYIFVIIAVACLLSD